MIFYFIINYVIADKILEFSILFTGRAQKINIISKYKKGNINAIQGPQWCRWIINRWSNYLWF